MVFVRKMLVCVALAGLVWAGNKDAAKLYQEGRQAERSGDVVRAYLLYSQAAALDPHHPEYWRHSLALRTRAALKAHTLPKLSDSDKLSTPADSGPPPAGFSTSISPEDLAEVRRMKPPPELKAKPGKQTLELRGDAKSMFEQVARAYGLGVAFDTDYQPGPPLRLRIQDADHREALHTLEAATGSFVVPITAHLFRVAKDTPPKRAELEPTVAVTIPIPDPVTVQEAQEMARAIQQTMEILKFSVDGTRRMVLIRDRISKVLPAEALFQQLAWRKPQVAIDIQFLEVNESSFLTFGAQGPQSFPILVLGNGSLSGATLSLARLFVGHTLLGIGIGNTQLFATQTRSSSKLLLDAEVLASDGSTANFHVGDKYPIMTGGFVGTSLGIPPAFTFEDLGLALKIIPHVHGEEEVTLEVSAEFRVLGSQSNNGIPSIANRKFESKVRLRFSQWAVIAGLMSNSEAKSISGLAGLSTLPALGPLFRQTDKNNTGTRVLVVLKPYLLSLPPSEALTKLLYLGSEGRLQIPL